MIQTVLTWYGTGEAKTAPDNGHRGNLRFSPVVLRDTKGMREHVSVTRLLRSPRSSVLFVASKHAVSRLLVVLCVSLLSSLPSEGLATNNETALLDLRISA
jgi:hypothetical protein